MNFHMMSIEETLKNFSTNIDQGLNDSQIIKSREKNGLNEFLKEKPISITKKILKSMLEPMNIMLFLAILITFTVNIIKKIYEGDAEFVECIGIFCAIFISTTITVIMENKSEKTFNKLNNENKTTLVKTLRNRKIDNIPQKQIVVGDIVFVESGNKIPADGRLIESISLYSDESSLTGEGEPVKKNCKFKANDKKIPIAERSNMIYSGCFITSGHGKMVVTGVGFNTEFGKIAKELSKNKENSTPLQKKLSKLGKTIALFGIFAGGFVFILQIIYFIKNKTMTFDLISNAFISSIVLIVAAVPEGLPAIVAASLGINMLKMLKQNALVKKITACETIGNINIICSDKTGTLTENKMTVTNIFINDKLLEPKNIKDNLLIENFCLNTTADIVYEDKLKKEKFLGSPTECALLVALKKSGIDYKKIRSSNKIKQMFAFSSETKNMTTIVQKDKKNIAYTKGSPEKILSLCLISSTKLKNIQEKIINFQKKSHRIIAFAYKELDNNFNNCTEINRKNIENNMIFCGFASINDPIRKGVLEAVEKCKSAGIELKILTGDNIFTACSIAKELKIMQKNCIAINAKELEEKTNEEFLTLLPKIKVIARSTPMIKMRVVNALKSAGHVVAVTGDGINDAPAIKNADIGIAMGITGTEVSKEASDIILLDDSFSTIVKSIEWGRGIYENFQRFIQFQLTVNLSSIIFILFSMITNLKSPFTTLQVLWINIIMDGPPALALGLAPIRENLMKKLPVKREENIITKNMMISIILNSLFIACTLLAQQKLNFLGVAKEQMTTVIFTQFIIFQIFNIFNNTKIDMSSIFKNPSINLIIFSTFLLTFFMQILITQFGKFLFSTVSLSFTMWIKIIGISIFAIIFSETFKIIKFCLKL
ncbi:MAG: calcium-translocating P-type ATPase, PMCA-type [Clostridiales bacterium]|nr:calcium-translocating P-type ATPase, PMCA-type [Clostridiales bacterium]